MAHAVDLLFPFGDPFHCYRFPTFQLGPQWPSG